MQVGIFNCLFIFVIAALNDYVIVASIIVIAIRNLINCAALVSSYSLKFRVAVYQASCFYHKITPFASLWGLGHPVGVYFVIKN